MKSESVTGPASERGMRFLVVVVAACAILSTVLAVQRSLFGSGSPRPRRSVEPVAIADWKNIASGGHRQGSPSAPVTIVVFGDYECPFCAHFETRVLPSVLPQFGDQVSVVHRHWPLASHEHAYAAARASECAHEQGRFDSIHRALYVHQDSIGRVPFDFFCERGADSECRPFSNVPS